MFGRQVRCEVARAVLAFSGLASSVQAFSSEGMIWGINYTCSAEAFNKRVSEVCSEINPGDEKRFTEGLRRWLELNETAARSMRKRCLEDGTDVPNPEKILKQINEDLIRQFSVDAAKSGSTRCADALLALERHTPDRFLEIELKNFDQSKQRN